MSVFCTLGAHAAAGQPVWNNGFYFSHCARCGRDLVRGAHEGWRAVPRGFKVVWRPRPEGYPDWSTTALPEGARPRLLPRPAAFAAEQAGLSSILGRS